MSEPSSPSAATLLTAVLAPDWRVIDHGQLLQVTATDGAHVALVGLDPVQVELELSVVLAAPEPADPEVLQAWAQTADAQLRATETGAWEAVGFVVPAVGELAEGEVLDDPERTIWSYELPVTVRAESLAQIRDIIAWGLAQERAFVLWDAEGPMTVLQPAT
jgi:hypothetical protein